MATSPRPWLESVSLHPDVLSDAFSEDIFALDLGPLADYVLGKELGLPESELPRVPTVYRDADSFFRASYITKGLYALLDDVLSRLSRQQGNRVMKLVTPFGGGKSHTLAALLHAARSRSALDAVAEAAALPCPERVRTAVVDGQFFDAAVGKRVPGRDFSVRTLWGWIAWCVGGDDGYELLREQDRQCIAPGADQLVELLRGAPTLILLDEVLEYLISAGGVKIQQTTLRDETLSFVKRLTVAVGGVDDAMLVFSLQASGKESLEYVSLLQTVDHLAARKDQRREPVEGSEILSVVQRRLLAKDPDPAVAGAVAEAYKDVTTQMRRAYAQTDDEREEASEEGLKLRDRIRAAYPFHPALIDVMRERWAAIPEFQRTRGALRFLAAGLRACHRSGRSRLLLGAGDVPLDDPEVRLAFFKEVGQREEFQPCLEHDFVGANARTRRIDERRAREVTAEAGKQPATRLATTILMYSFGGLRRAEASDGDLLPPGISEQELLTVCVAPDLDSTTAQACIKELREQCLYLHFDGARYRFKQDPNVTLMVEQESEVIGRDLGRVEAKIRELLEERMAGERAAVIWPQESTGIPDGDPRFLVAYLPLSFGALSDDGQRTHAIRLLAAHGDRKRNFRNGVGLAVPSNEQIDALRRSVRYLLAVERVQTRARELHLTDPQKDQLRERAATERAAVESSLLRLYAEVWLPSVTKGDLTLDRVAIGGRPLQNTLDDKKRAMVHQRVIELLTLVQPKVFTSLAPGKISELFKLTSSGDGARGVPTDEVVRAFYSFLGYPRLMSSEVIRQAIARAVEIGLLAYTIGHPKLGATGTYELSPTTIRYREVVPLDELDLDSGFVIIPEARPQAVTDEEPKGDGAPSVPEPAGGGGTAGDGAPPSGVPSATGRTAVDLAFRADRNALFTAWNAVANLADLAGHVEVSIRARAEAPMAEAKLENGVMEPLREAGLIEDDGAG